MCNVFCNVTNYRVVKSNDSLAARVERTKNFRCVACDVNTTVSTLSLSRRHFCVPWSLSILLPLYLSLSPPPPPFNTLSFSFQASLLFLASNFPSLSFPVHTNLRLPLFLLLSLCHCSLSTFKRLSPFFANSRSLSLSFSRFSPSDPLASTLIFFF